MLGTENSCTVRDFCESLFSYSLSIIILVSENRSFKYDINIKQFLSMKYEGDKIIIIKMH